MFFKNKKPSIPPEQRPRRSVASQSTQRSNLRDGAEQLAASAKSGPAGGGRIGRSRASESRRAAPARLRNTNQVYSYRSSRSQRQETLGRITPEQAEAASQWKERLSWVRSMPRIIALLVVLLVLISILRLDTRATVAPMDDAKGQVFLRSLRTYEDAVQHILAGSLLNRNKITVNTAQISDEIKRQFPELKTVSVSLPLSGSRPIVYIQPAVPALVLSATNGAIYVIDTDGKALITSNQVPDQDALRLPVVIDESGIVIAAGKVALPSSSVAFIREVVGQLEAKRVSVQSLSLPSGASELRVRVSGKAYYIAFNLHGDAREEAGVYLAVRRELDLKHVTPAVYIDVRVPNKAYYK